MYKPSIFEHPQTKQKALQINLFELPTLNKEMRKYFMDDYKGRTWFWHRFVWKLPAFVLSSLELIYIVFASLFYSPKESYKILTTKFQTRKAEKKKINPPTFNDIKVGECFDDKAVKDLAKLIRQYYCSCLWKQGDILLVDNKQVVHAGMPGAGTRLIRAMICNPLTMRYSFTEPGYLQCKQRSTDTIGAHMLSGEV